MKLLILGGTRFVGRAIVSAALDSGAEVTVVHRGTSNPDLFGSQVRHIIADRLVSLEPLPDESWDACIDTCGYIPRAVEIAADAISYRVGHYSFISTISVYQDPPANGDESSPLAPIGDPTNETIDNETYGYLKVLCEEAVRRRFPSHTIVRPGLIVGPHDHTDRFTYWPVRISEGSEVLTPSGPDRPIQFIDVRDLADFILKATNERIQGTFNAVGPREPITLRRLLSRLRDIVNPRASFDEQDIEALGLQPWVDLPLVVAPEDNMMRLSAEKAIAAGLTYRQLEETVGDLMQWWKSENRALRSGR